MIRSAAIVLAVVRYDDARSIVDCYTEQVGRVSFMVRRSRTGRGALRPAMFLPLAQLELEWADHANRSLQHLRSARLVHPYRTLTRDVSKATQTLFLQEFLAHALRADGGDRALFAFVSSSLLWLDAATHGVANFHLAFLIHLSQFLGFYPNVDDYAPGLAFSLESGCYCPVTPAPHLVPPVEARLLPLLLRMNYATLHLFRFTRAQREHLLALIQAYYRLHLPSFPELRSLEVLKAVFND